MGLRPPEPEMPEALVFSTPFEKYADVPLSENADQQGRRAALLEQAKIRDGVDLCRVAVVEPGQNTPVDRYYIRIRGDKLNGLKDRHGVPQVTPQPREEDLDLRGLIESGQGGKLLHYFSFPRPPTHIDRHNLWMSARGRLENKPAHLKAK